MQPTYIESSDVKNGKTNRLLAAAAQALAYGHSVVVYTPPSEIDGKYNGVHYGDALKPFITGDAKVVWHSYNYLLETYPTDTEKVWVFCDDAHLTHGTPSVLEKLASGGYIALRADQHPALKAVLQHKWGKDFKGLPSADKPEEEVPRAGHLLPGAAERVAELDEKIAVLMRSNSNPGALEHYTASLRNYLDAVALAQHIHDGV